MKIVVPVNSLKDAQILLKEGADVLYCGVHEERGREGDARFGEASPNRRVGDGMNLSSFDELTRLVKEAHLYGKTVQFCINAVHAGYSPCLEEHINAACQAGVDEFVVTDLPAIRFLRKKNFKGKIAISSGVGIFNSPTIKFFSSMGASAMVLPRSLSIEEIKALSAVSSDIDFSVFIRNQACANVTTACAHLRIDQSYQFFFKTTLTGVLFRAARGIYRFLGLGKRIKDVRTLLINMPFLSQARIPGCSKRYSVSCRDVLEGEADDSRYFEKVFYERAYAIDACAACSLIELIGSNVSSCKIVGREYSTKKKVMDVRFVKEALKIAEDKEVSISEGQEKIRSLYHEVYGYPCRGYCYYELARK